MKLLRSALAVACFLLAACGRYAEFRLPAPPGQPASVSPEWELLPGPVLTRGPEGEWDSVDVLNPSIVQHERLYYNLYSGYDGHTWHTGLATSTDGIAWTKRGKVLSPEPLTWEGGYIAANGSVLRFGGEFLYWYQAGDPPRIGLANSRDALNWVKRPTPVLETGPRGSWDERGVADPYVIEAGGKLYLYYLGQDRARRQRLGVAVSADGIAWTKLRSNPILEIGEPGAFDETGLGEPAVWAFGGRYWMLYTARDRAEVRRLGLAVSEDGVRWERHTQTAVLAGAEAWNSQVVCDPTVILSDGRLMVWYGGGDAPRPDENVNGQIGLAWLTLRNAKLAK